MDNKGVTYQLRDKGMYQRLNLGIKVTFPMRFSQQDGFSLGGIIGSLIENWFYRLDQNSREYYYRYTYTDYILDFLASQGVDTSREFVINGTHCELVNGKIREVGNDYVVPSSIQQKAVKRYEESMSQLLNSGTWYRWS